MDLKHTFIETLNRDSNKVDVLTVVAWVYAYAAFNTNDMTKDNLAPETSKVSNHSNKRSLTSLKPINISPTVKICVAKC